MESIRAFQNNKYTHIMVKAGGKRFSWFHQFYASGSVKIKYNRLNLRVKKFVIKIYTFIYVIFQRNLNITS